MTTTCRTRPSGRVRRANCWPRRRRSASCRSCACRRTRRVRSTIRVGRSGSMRTSTADLPSPEALAEHGWPTRVTRHGFDVEGLLASAVRSATRPRGPPSSTARSASTSERCGSDVPGHCARVDRLRCVDDRTEHALDVRMATSGRQPARARIGARRRLSARPSVTRAIRPSGASSMTSAPATTRGRHLRAQVTPSRPAASAAGRGRTWTPASTRASLDQGDQRCGPTTPSGTSSSRADAVMPPTPARAARRRSPAHPGALVALVRATDQRRPAIRGATGRPRRREGSATPSATTSALPTIVTTSHAEHDRNRHPARRERGDGRQPAQQDGGAAGHR